MLGRLLRNIYQPTLGSTVKSSFKLANQPFCYLFFCQSSVVKLIYYQNAMMIETTFPKLECFILFK